MPQNLLVVDQGSSSTKCFVFDSALHPVARAEYPVRSSFPAEGHVEHDPQELLSSTIDAAHDAVAQAGCGWDSVAAVGLAAQTETFVVWDGHTGAPAHPAVSWRDNRAEDLCLDLERRGLVSDVRARTGLPLKTAFTAPKLSVLLETCPDVRDGIRRGDLLVGDVNSWLIWKMTGGRAHVTDASMASRTMLYNLQEGRWDRSLADLFAVPLAALPSVGPTLGMLAWTDPAVCGFKLPIAAALGDQQAGLFAQRCWSAGLAKLTLGTGAFLWLNAGRKPPDAVPPGAVASVAWAWPGEHAYALEGFVPNAGSAISWLHDSGLFPRGQWPAIRPGSLERGSGVRCVPALFGLGTPHWEPRRHAHLIGMTADTTVHDVGEATLLGVAQQVADAIDALSGSADGVREAQVDGGLSANSSLLQAICDLTGITLRRSQEADATSRGVAMLAGIALGWWTVATLSQRDQASATEMSPSLTVAARQKARSQWRELLAVTGELGRTSS
jgi:glycerol kinase